MVWGIATLLLAGAMLIRITLRIDLCRDGETHMRILAQAVGVHKAWTHHRAGQSAFYHQNLGSRLMQTLRRSYRARLFFLRHSAIKRLDVLLLLHTEDAAQSALVSASLQHVFACIPNLYRRHARIRVLPEFFRGHSSFRLRGIVCFRLGTIVLTTGLLFLDWLKEQRLTESEVS